MLTTFHAGFADELVKTAGIRDIVKRIVHGKPIPKMGFFEKRRIAKALGVKSRDVERTLQERQGKDRLTKALVAGGGLGAGTVLGGAMDKQADGMAGAGAGSYAPPAPKPPSDQDLIARRDALMRQRGVQLKPAAPKPAAGGYDPKKFSPDQIKLMQRRDDLMKQRQDQSLITRRDALMKTRQPLKPTGPLVAKR